MMIELGKNQKNSKIRKITIQQSTKSAKSKNISG